MIDPLEPVNAENWRKLHAQLIRIARSIDPDPTAREFEWAGRGRREVGVVLQPSLDGAPTVLLTVRHGYDTPEADLWPGADGNPPRRGHKSSFVDELTVHPGSISRWDAVRYDLRQDEFREALRSEGDRRARPRTVPALHWLLQYLPPTQRRLLPHVRPDMRRLSGFPSVSAAAHRN